MRYGQIKEMSAHTPGPWGVRKIESDGGLVYCLIGNPTSIRKMRGGIAFAGTYARRALDNAPTGERIAVDETLANARLIAAAPDLLMALRAMLDAVSRTTYPEGHAIWKAGDMATDAIAKAEGKS